MIVALPTRRGWLMIVFTAGAVSVGCINVGLATAIAAALPAGILLASFFMAQFSLYFLKLERLSHQDGVVGQDILLPLVLANRGWYFRQGLLIREKLPFAPNGISYTEVPALRPREKIQLRRILPVELRGEFKLHVITVLGGDPAGLFRKARTFRRPDNVVIYPKIESFSGISLLLSDNVMPGSDGRPLGHSGMGQEFYGLRPYRPGDEIRFIHWKGTAAKRQLMIREFEANTVDRVVLLLDSHRAEIGFDARDNNFEYLIGLAASLAQNLSEIYCRLQFYTFHGNNGELLALEGDAAGIHQKLLQLLLMLQPGKHAFQPLLETLVERIPPGAMVYALSLSGKETDGKLLELLLDRGCQIRWIWAPPQNFPPREHNKPRVLHSDQIKYTGKTAIFPRIADYRISYRKLLQ